MLLADIAPSTDEIVLRAAPFFVAGLVALGLGAWLLKRPGKQAAPAPREPEKPVDPGI